jgi:hypothetical protein
MMSYIYEILYKVISYTIFLITYPIGKFIWKILELDDVDHMLRASESDLGFVERITIKFYNIVISDDMPMYSHKELWWSLTAITTPISGLVLYFFGSYGIHWFVDWLLPHQTVVMSYQNASTIVVLSGSIVASGAPIGRITRKREFGRPQEINTAFQRIVGLILTSIGLFASIMEPFRLLLPVTLGPANFITAFIFMVLTLYILHYETKLVEKWDYET